MSSHRIRLPAPWRVTRSSDVASRVAPAAAPDVVFHRSFQRPTGLRVQSAIGLEITLLEPLTLQVVLNGTSCALDRRGELLIHVPLTADQLQPVNELELTVQVPAGAAAVQQPKLGNDFISSVELVLD